MDELTLIPNYVEARDLKELRASCLKNNLIKQKAFRYQDIQFTNGKWYAFYFEDARIELEAKIINDAKKEGSK